MKHQYRPILKITSVFLVINFVFNIIYPTVAMALTAGPSSPEFSTFTPVSSNELVNTFTGDFSYNIPAIEVPGPNGSGYSMSLAYNSGSTAESEASWVGLGWTLNPGSISRNLRGFPDEYNGEPIQYYNKSRPNWTATASTTAGLEAFSQDMSVGLKAGFVHRINNYTGYQKVISYGANFNGLVGVDATKDVNGTSYRPYISPMALYKSLFDKPDKQPQTKKEKNDLAKANRNANCKLSTQRGTPSVGIGGLNLADNSFSISLVPPTPPPFNYPTYLGFSLNWSVSLGVNPAIVPIGITAGKAGTFSYRYNKPFDEINAYGYNHSFTQKNEGDEKSQMLDYYIEKNRPFSASEYFIGIPHNSYDVFSVSGEGIGGGFKSFIPEIGHLSPKVSNSSTLQNQIGFEVMVGTNIGVGLDFGVGIQNTNVQRWANDDSNSESNSHSYRFNNDLGGEAIYDDNTDLSCAGVTVVGFPGSKSCFLQRTPKFDLKNTGSSAFITEKLSGNLLTGMEIVNKDGVTMVYGEPMMVKNETSLSVDITKADPIKNNSLAFADLKLRSSNGKYGVAKSDFNEHTTLVGQINPNKYATSFLLTEIKSPSYIDTDKDQTLSNNDFGGWTRFGYETVYGGGSEWYRYRMPYKGLYYQKNSVSDTKDDLGSVETGEKEVKYLKKIETKSHVAYFVTNKTVPDQTVNYNPYVNGSQKDRLDGIGAIAVEETKDPASEVSGEPFGDTQLRYLEKIVLFAKNADGKVHADQKPLKTVRFEYDYSLVPNVPNNKNSNFSYIDKTNTVNENNGKLTLRKVWVEYEGLVSAKISPYVFSYNYPTFAAGSKLAAFFGPNSGYESLMNGDVQNPSYSPYGLDAWGNMTPNIQKRRHAGIAWTDQSAFVNNTIVYDPAAYQLKTIQLPSGGNIIIQYEKKDYAHVQNREAMAMACVKPATGNSGIPHFENYIVDVANLGVDPTNKGQVDALVQKINKHFEQKVNLANPTDFNYDTKIYFKFLFSLLDGVASIDNSMSEYITGYADFKGASCSENPDAEGKYTVTILLGGEGEDEKGGAKSLTPLMACREFVANQRQGKIKSGDCIEPEYERKYDDLLNLAASGDDWAFLHFSVIAKILASMAIGEGLGKYSNFDKDDPKIGKNINVDLSFVKLPMGNDKIGGGARVKRILLHDRGIEAGDEVLLGTEYTYEMEDGTSSGVATNEPGQAREENPIVDFLPKKGQPWYKRIVSNEVLDQTEGPIGEALLPSASIGYRRVVIENIHKGKTGNGYSIDTYNTVFDYPFDKYYSRVMTEGAENKYDFEGKTNEMGYLHEDHDDFRLMAGLFNFVVSKQWATQGFKFIQTNMHGMPKSKQTFSGTYSDKTSNRNGYLVSGQEYEYFEPGEKTQVVGFDKDNNFVKSNVFPGKEMDIARESKLIDDISMDFNVELDISVGLNFAPPVFVGLWPSINYNENVLATHATTKVISYPTILKSTTTTVEGVRSRSENLMFDVLTGDPVLVKNSDSYDGATNTTDATKPSKMNSDFYSLSVPASWIYKQMGQKSKDDTNSNQLNAKAVQFLIHNDSPTPGTAWLDNPKNLISAVITTYGENWGSAIANESKILQDHNIDPAKFTASIQGAMDAKWLPKGSYTYKSDVDNTSNSIDRGTFSIPSLKWDLSDLGSWIKTSEISKYSPNSAVLEERDVLNIPSAVVYGKQYNNNVPSIVSNNADYNTILFEDFETLETLGGASPIAHSGKSSRVVSEISNLLPGIKVTSLLKRQGAIVRFWMSSRVPDLKLTISNSAIPAEGSTGTEPLQPTDIDLTWVATVDGWSLYQGVIKGTQHLGSVVIADNTPLVEIKGLLSSSTQSIGSYYIDDVRFQPLHSSANCYVYDPLNLRLLAQFDDQHFGTYFQYNQEGKLVRKIIETERGKHTLQEMNYNTPSSLRAGNE